MSEEATFNVAFVCVIPRVPNFLCSEQGQMIDVADCTDNGLRGLGRAWTAALIDNARQRRIDRAEPEQKATPDNVGIE
jgi:hypothetical protein